MLDAVTDSQAISDHGLTLSLIGLRFMKFMHRINATFRISGMKLSYEN